MKLFLGNIRKKIWIYQQSWRHGMEFKRMSKKGVLPENLSVDVLATLALQFSLTAFASRAYAKGDISKKECYLELERLDSLLRETLKMSWDDFRVLYRYSLGGIF